MSTSVISLTSFIIYTVFSEEFPEAQLYVVRPSEQIDFVDMNFDPPPEYQVSALCPSRMISIFYYGAFLHTNVEGCSLSQHLSKQKCFFFCYIYLFIRLCSWPRLLKCRNNHASLKCGMAIFSRNIRIWLVDITGQSRVAFRAT